MKQAISARLYRWIVIVAAVIGLMVLLEAIAGPLDMGRAIYLVCGGWALMFVERAERGLVSGLLEDRRNQTLGLVVLTGARAWELFLSKILGRGAAAVYPAMALLPCMMLSVLCGGISGEVCVATALLIPTIVVFLASFDFLAVALRQEAESAEQLALALKVGAAIWPFCIDYLVRAVTGNKAPEAVYLLTPASAVVELAVGSPDFERVIACIAVSSAVGLVILGGAGWLLDRGWREHGMGDRARSFLSEVNRRWAKKIEPLREASPLLWLAVFDRSAVRIGWATLIVAVVSWACAAFAWGNSWLVPISFYLVISVVLVSAHALIYSAGARRLARNRADGLLELLLTTPVTPRDIIVAETRAVGLQFGRLINCVRLLVIVLLAGATLSHHWSGKGIAAHVLISLVFVFLLQFNGAQNTVYCLWRALNLGPGSQIQGQKALFVYSIWLAYLVLDALRNGLSGLRSFPTDDPMHLGIAIGIFAYYWVAMAGMFTYTRQCGELLERHFREVAQSPLPSAAERAKWDGMGPLIGRGQ